MSIYAPTSRWQQPRHAEYFKETNQSGTGPRKNTRQVKNWENIMPVRYNFSATLLGHRSATLLGHRSATMLGYCSATMLGHRSATLLGYRSATLLGHRSATLLGHRSVNAQQAASIYDDFSYNILSNTQRMPVRYQTITFPLATSAQEF